MVLPGFVSGGSIGGPPLIPMPTYQNREQQQQGTSEMSVIQTTLHLKAYLNYGHEDDMVIELENVVRKVHGYTGLGIQKESNNNNRSKNRLTGPSHKPKTPHKLLHLLEVIAMNT
ncbi:unnamed protein product [Lactuca saligna]|uniref:Uncharacterized protein n=1 Tax=Lactuca saligna TaxID=75948 RepID=A0AA35YWY8_LACSI|nr:unnamed protein product [Lactuca saligna]